jgi:8-oxo-dGTP pyrophosphatase MutT (NUDIX family)
MQDQSKSWKLIHSETLFKMKLFDVRLDEVLNPNTDKPVKVVVLSGNDSVNVLAITKSGNAVLVDNYRFGTGAYLLELPGGMVDDGEDHQQSAQRELLEETGYTAREWRYAGCIASNPVFMNSYVHHYLALDAEKVAEANLDDAEDIRVREVPLEEVRKLLYDGEFQHPHTVSGILRGMEMLRRL